MGFDGAVVSERTIFLAALDIADPARRGAYLAGACGADAGLRGRVEGLLRAHVLAGSFLDQAGPALEPLGAARAEALCETLPPSDTDAGTIVGHYRLTRPLGEGGMGVVYLAEQYEPVRRQVALKLVKPGMDSKQVLARFEAERQALAIMDHPNIAQVFDGGATASGRPYFVMELVKGVPITDFCDQNRLPPRQRLELFLSVCQAVQHAHQKAIIHRDLKPSNVLVARHDTAPVVKVIDFGVAKALGRELTDKTLFTGVAQMVGTPLYMSPEQAGQSGLDVDTRSDIYSLGVLLYELLTGTTPFTRERFKNAGYDEICRIIREEEPARPSKRLSSLGQDRATVSANRGSDPRALSRLFRGELDWIVLKALEKDPDRRYETASGLALDVQRYLADEPVQARPPSTGYRLGKFIRRNRRPVLAASLVVLALVGGIVGTTWQAVRATRARHEAEANRRKAHQAVNHYFTLISESTLLDQPALEPLRRQLLEEARRYYEGFVEERAGDPELRAELVAAYMRIAAVTHDAHSGGDWLPALQKATSLIEDLMKQKPDLETMPSLRAGIYRVNTSVLTRFPNFDEVLSTYERICNVWERLVREHPAEPGFQNDLALVHFSRGLLLVHKGRPAEALASHERAIALRQQLVQTHPGRPDYRAALATSEDGVGRTLVILGRPAEAEQALDRAIALMTQLVADFPDAPAWREVLSGRLYIRRGGRLEHAERLEEATQAYRQSLAGQEALMRDYPTVGRYRSGVFHARLLVGKLLWATGRRAEAAEVYDSVRTLGEKLKPDDLDDLAEWAWFLAACPDPRFRDTRRAVDLAKRLIEGAPQNGAFWGTLGAAYFGNGDWEEAVRALQEATQLPSSPSLASVSFLVRTSSSSVNGFYLAMACRKTDQVDEARQWYDQAVVWMDQQRQQDVETRRLRAEAEKLLGIRDKEE
jgi:eukaryotic-like serine/threonine-protein kinase